MKMDTMQQETKQLKDSHQPEHVCLPFHFTPLIQPDVANEEAGPSPDTPDSSGDDKWSASRDVVPIYFERQLPAPTTLDSERRRKHAKDMIDEDIDIRFASARDMARASMELYIRGMISWEEYFRLAFQPELHPDYDATIGALLGESAAPDKPRDFVRLWEERLAFERRYNVADARHIRATERITLIMRRLAGINSLRA